MAPALASIKAIPLPIPRDAPVTMHTLPDNKGSSDDVMVHLGDLLLLHMEYYIRLAFISAAISLDFHTDILPSHNIKHNCLTTLKNS